MTREHNMPPWEGAQALCEAGVLRAARRAGFPPMLWKEEVELELDFEGPKRLRTFRVMTGPTGANDVNVADGTALELFSGHLRDEEPDTYAEIMAAWRLDPEPDVQWAVGARLSRPVRLEMTAPYVEVVGFAFDCERDGRLIGRLMLFASADILFAVREDHSEVTKYGLREAAS